MAPGDRARDSPQEIFLRLVGQPYRQVGESVSVANRGFYVHGIRPAVRLHMEGSVPASQGYAPRATPEGKRLLRTYHRATGSEGYWPSTMRGHRSQGSLL